eukprot:20320-Heterococcus_DN1.PRE.1
MLLCKGLGVDGFHNEVSALKSVLARTSHSDCLNAVRRLVQQFRDVHLCFGERAAYVLDDAALPTNDVPHQLCPH